MAGPSSYRLNNNEENIPTCSMMLNPNGCPRNSEPTVASQSQSDCVCNECIKNCVKKPSLVESNCVVEITSENGEGSTTIDSSGRHRSSQNARQNDGEELQFLDASRSESLNTRQITMTRPASPNYEHQFLEDSDTITLLRLPRNNGAVTNFICVVANSMSDIIRSIPFCCLFILAVFFTLIFTLCAMLLSTPVENISDTRSIIYTRRIMEITCLSLFVVIAFILVKCVVDCCFCVQYTDDYQELG